MKPASDAAIKPGSLLGKGTYSTVRAQLHKGKMVAVKKAVCELWHFAAKEVIILRFLSHPNIVKVYDVFCDGKVFSFAMPLHGETLCKKMHRGDTVQLFDYFVQICGAVAYCHSAGVIHGDIKSENILCDGHHATLCDFGLARVTTVCRGISTSVLYRAPEITMSMPWTNKVDVWSLGILLYEICRLENNLEGVDGDMTCTLSVYSTIFGTPFKTHPVETLEHFYSVLGKSFRVLTAVRCLCFDPNERLSSFTLYEWLLCKHSGKILTAPTSFAHSIQSEQSPTVAEYHKACFWDQDGAPETAPVPMVDLAHAFGWSQP